MSLTNFTNLMTHTVNLRKRNRDYKGDFVDVDTNELKGFVQYGNHYTTNENKEKLLSSAIVFLSDSAIPYIDISHENYMIDQTSPYVRSNMEVLKIDPIDDPRTGKTHHFEIYVR